MIHQILRTDSAYTYYKPDSGTDYTQRYKTAKSADTLHTDGSL